MFYKTKYTFGCWRYEQHRKYKGHPLFSCPLFSCCEELTLEGPRKVVTELVNSPIKTETLLFFLYFFVVFLVSVTLFISSNISTFKPDAEDGSIY